MSKQETALAKYLKSLREASGMTLRAVEHRTGVSNAFLSQLESGKVKQPSPVVLYKLAQVYGVSYEALMEHARYPVPQAADYAKPVNAQFYRLGPLTNEEEESLLEYLLFLRSRTARRGGRR